jgi:hypothetical protein
MPCILQPFARTGVCREPKARPTLLLQPPNDQAPQETAGDQQRVHRVGNSAEEEEVVVAAVVLMVVV